MKRRDFIKLTGAATGAIVTTQLQAKNGDKQQELPNVVVVHTDQQSTWTLGSYGGTIVKTPFIDSLADEGAKLNNFYCNVGVCTPSRGCFFSGQYPDQNGAVHNDKPLNRDVETFGEMARRNGYNTAYFGKWHLDGDAKPGFMKPDRSMGFTDCEHMWNRGHWKTINDNAPRVSDKIGDKEHYTTDYISDKTIDFIKSQEKNQPFMAVLSIPDPHTPFKVRAPYNQLVNPDLMSIPESFDQKDTPVWIKQHHWHNPKHTLEDFKEAKAQYYAMVKCIDDNVGKIINTLKDKGVYDNTIIVFTTDHGEYMGEHGGLLGKNNFYQNAYRIPFLIRFPKKIKPGTVVKQHVTTVDFKSTLASLMGVTPEKSSDGRDMTPLLESKVDTMVDDYAIVCRHGRNIKSAFIGLYNDDYSICYSNTGKDHMLFDMKKDPLQMDNLFDDRKYRKVKKELTKVLVSHVDTYQNKFQWLKDHI
ncbi:sulfatase-like hydrolase/transferase [Halosquirtibacter xylanolyticus]|uniref:sulfatase-like hydrolase/transferase n=1 Tax=Halosquirtibacter xylanolyticus TaxID=3374599 RepID=UPI003749F956|nr:sulfatase-like hydrolase/transferase [Prolixibacteraceae bacterium]